MNTVKDQAIAHGVRPEALYLCMEEDAQTT